MRVRVEWKSNNWTITALEGRAKGRVVAHAAKVILREVEFGTGRGGRGITANLDGMDGEETRAGRDMTVLRLFYWMNEDARYMTIARKHGRAVRRSETAPHFEADHSAPGRPQWVRTNDSPMVALAARLGAPVILAFDPCTIPL